ncbi:acetylcholine receptor subunit alpha-type deg-3-like [Haemaphysalis longicornis]
MLRKMRIIFLLLFSLSYNVQGQDIDGNRISHHKNLLKYLFDSERYSRDIRPVRSHKNATKLTLDLSIQEIAEMDHSRQTVRMNVIISAKWKDEFLTWNPVDYGGEDVIVVPAESIWTPEIISGTGAAQLMATSAAASKGRLRQAMARVSATGDVSLHHTKQLPALCVAVADGFASAGHYNCTATVESWDFTYSEVRLHGSVDVAPKNSAWEVSRPRMRFHFSVMEFELALKKKYEANLVCPTVAVMLLTLASFWLPASGPRITLGCVNLLVTVICLATLSVHYEGYTQTAPHVAFLSVSAALVATSLAWAVVIHKLLHSADRCEAPRDLVRALEAPFWQFLCVGGYQPASSVVARETEMERLSEEDSSASPPSPSSTTPPPTVGSEEDEELRRREEWNAVSRAVDRILFAAYAALFVFFRLFYAAPYWGTTSV